MTRAQTYRAISLETSYNWVNLLRLMASLRIRTPIAPGKNPPPGWVAVCQRGTAAGGINQTRYDPMRSQSIWDGESLSNWTISLCHSHKRHTQHP
ncbi:hypothetical protein [Laspinema olomoucense]|uniref:hypothetical protein n=1 Tax=Laspinema olomoucense TaxID=3231600 RepID=UPI0021BB85F9|nr:hypothetical protein [Laspinema sp. D3c]MCT7992439.1 hypothetical protein [Laspinema sp. D3c]